MLLQCDFKYMPCFELCSILSLLIDFIKDCKTLKKDLISAYCNSVKFGLRLKSFWWLVYSDFGTVLEGSMKPLFPELQLQNRKPFVGKIF